MNKSTAKLIVVLALFCSILNAQTNGGSVKGFVTDAKSRDTLIGAIVSVDAKNAVAADIHGFFEIGV